MRKKPLLILLCVSSLVLFAGCMKKNDNPADSKPAYTFPLSLQKDMDSSLKRAYQWLRQNQAANGSWKYNPAITSLVLYSLVESPGRETTPVMEQSILRGYTYLKSFVQADGGIYENEYRNYTTAVALLAFTAHEATYASGEYKDIILGGKDFLIRFQVDETEAITAEDPFYGGIGYGGDTRPDLSNTQLALEAIKAAEDYERLYNKIIPENEKALKTENETRGLHWEKALLFLARCQNLEGVNTMTYRTDNDGGFMYESGTYKEERSHSYGSMTYAGVKSLLYADVDRNDLRVVKAMEWIRANYTLENNPGFEDTSLYYYYMTFAKCFNALGMNSLTDSAGTVHLWREELVAKLLALQKGDGFWVNDNGRYWENIPELTTAYCLVALKYGLKGLSMEDIK